MGSIDRTAGSRTWVVIAVLRARPPHPPGRGLAGDSAASTARTTTIAGVALGRQPPQLDELEAQCLEVRDVAVQCGPVRDRADQQRVGARLDALEWRERCGQGGWDPARDPEGVVNVHVGLPFRTCACALMV